MIDLITRRISAALLLSMLSLAACSTPSGPSDDIASHPVAYWLTAERRSVRYADSTIVSSHVNALLGIGEESRRLPATTVLFEGTPLMKAGGDTSFYRLDAPPGDLPLRIDGSYHRWSIEEKGDLPALTDSSRAPSRPIEISAPMPGDTLSKSEGFTLRWEPSNDPDSRITYLIVGIEGVGVLSGTMLPDSGALRITPEMLRLAGVKPGSFFVKLTRTITRDLFTPDRRRVQMQIASSQAIFSTVKN